MARTEGHTLTSPYSCAVWPPPQFGVTLTVPQMSHLCQHTFRLPRARPAGSHPSCTPSLHNEPGTLVCPVWIHLQREHYLPFRKKAACRSHVGPAPRVERGGRLFSPPWVACTVHSLSAGCGSVKNCLCTCGTEKHVCCIAFPENVCPEA